MTGGNGGDDTPRHSAPAGAARARRSFPRYRRSKARFEGRSDSVTAPGPSDSHRSMNSEAPIMSENPNVFVPQTNVDEISKSTHTTPLKTKPIMFETGSQNEMQTPQKNQKILAEITSQVGNVTIGSASKSAWVPDNAKATAGTSTMGRAQDAEVSQAILQETQKILQLDENTNSLHPRPLVCLDINKSGEDMLYLSNIPKNMSYDRLFDIVEPFGDVEALNWSTEDPQVCEVIYKDASAAREAVHFLDKAIIGEEKEPRLAAELRSREAGAQLFVGDLTPDVTEQMLADKFMEIVGSTVTAKLKRDPETFSPIGYGFLSFQSENDADRALVAGHRIKVGKACIRVGRAERNTHLYVTDLAPEVTMPELHSLFSRFGALVEEDTVIVRRSYAFVRFKDRLSAENAKRTLDKTDFHGRITVRYAEAEPRKACISVQFHSSFPKAPGSIRELLFATFSKYGNCSVEIPRLRNGQWRKVAYVTFQGEPVSACLAATEAVQSVRFVSTVPVCCQFARELIPRVPPRDLRSERGRSQSNSVSGAEAMVNARLRVQPEAPRQGPTIRPSSVHPPAEHGVMGMTRDLVPVYVPMSALHPLSIQQGHITMAEGDYVAPVNWENRVFAPVDNSNQQQHTGNPHQHHLSNREFEAGPSSGGPGGHQDRPW